MNERDSSRILWGTLEQIRESLALDTRSMAYLMKISADRYRDQRRRCTVPSAVAVMSLAKSLHIDYDAIIEGRVNFPTLIGKRQTDNVCHFVGKAGAA